MTSIFIFDFVASESVLSYEDWSTRLSLVLKVLDGTKEVMSQDLPLCILLFKINSMEVSYDGIYVTTQYLTVDSFGKLVNPIHCEPPVLNQVLVGTCEKQQAKLNFVVKTIYNNN